MSQNEMEEIQRLKREWESRRPLDRAIEERLWQKLRLEWNYHSNHLEGNTLTYGETELLLLHGETRGNHTLREYQEMKAHDAAIEQVRHLAREERPLTEAEVRSLNRMILVEPFWSPALTTDGAPTRKQIIPGQYKAQPNNVRTTTGAMFHFADPIDVPHRMQLYMRELNVPLPAGEQFLPRLSELHHQFLIIHPFDDGNGRVGRLLLNYALLKAGYLPLIIRTDNRQVYLSALHQADIGTGNYAELSSLFGAAIRASFELAIGYVSKI